MSSDIDKIKHNPTWQGTATELLSKLEINDIKPNTLSLKLNVNAGRLYTEYFIKYVNKRSHGVRRIELKYDLDHPIINIPDDIIHQPVDYGEMMITADNIDEIAGADYDERYQDMINNCLG